MEGTLSASMLTTDQNRKSILYKSYPNDNCEEKNLPPKNHRKGTFLQLEQLMGIGFERQNMNEIVSLFSWDEEEKHELSLLKGINTRDTMNDKKYRHLCYLSESAFALAVSDRLNISSNPGFEWQLRYYGN